MFYANASLSMDIGTDRNNTSAYDIVHLKSHFCLGFLDHYKQLIIV